LPTEKEWEFAARDGLTGREYSWGDNESLARDYANYVGRGGRDKWDESTAPVGSFKPSGYGLFDMAGNVWEWCQDWSDSNKPRRVLRGGAWYVKTGNLRVSSRNDLNPQIGLHEGLGFRCVSGRLPLTRAKHGPLQAHEGASFTLGQSATNTARRRCRTDRACIWASC